MIGLLVLCLGGAALYIRHVFNERDHLQAELIDQGRKLHQAQERYDSLQADIAKRDAINKSQQHRIEELHTTTNNLRQLLKSTHDDCPVSPGLNNMLQQLYQEKHKQEKPN